MAVVGQSAEAVWSIAQATLLSDRRATVGVAGGAGGAEEDDEDDAHAAVEGGGDDGGDGGNGGGGGGVDDPLDTAAPLLKAREHYLKNVFVNAITKGPDPQERGRRVRRAAPAPASSGPFVFAAPLPLPPPPSGAAARPRKALGAKPWKREREDLAEKRKAKLPRRVAKAKDPDEEKIEAIFGQPVVALEPIGDSNEQALVNFPVGDVFLEEGKPEQSMERNGDYDYVEEDSEELQQMRRRSRGRGRGRRRRPAEDAPIGRDNHIAEYEHSELFEELGVMRAPKDAPPPVRCSHELQEATALRQLPPPSLPATHAASSNPAHSAAAIAGSGTSAIVVIETEIKGDDVQTKLALKENGGEGREEAERVSSYMKHAHKPRLSDESDDYEETGEMSSDYDSLDFEEALERRERRRGRSSEDWSSSLGSCEARDWMANDHEDPLPTCQV